MMKSGMTGKFLDGIKIADDIKREVSAEVQTLKESGIQPGLAVVLVGDDAASSAYVNMKSKTCEQLGIYSRKLTVPGDRKSTRLNSSHANISYAVFCLKKKKTICSPPPARRQCSPSRRRP